jgi:ClpP class serine protease
MIPGILIDLHSCRTVGGGCVHASRLPPMVAAVNRDQPRFAPWYASPTASGSYLIAVRADCLVAARAP